MMSQSWSLTPALRNQMTGKAKKTPQNICNIVHFNDCVVIFIAIK